MCMLTNGYMFLLQDGNDFGENYSDLRYVMTEVSYILILRFHVTLSIF